jgi:hypothetical protein
VRERERVSFGFGNVIRNERSERDGMSDIFFVAIFADMPFLKGKRRRFGIQDSDNDVFIT